MPADLYTKFVLTAIATLLGVIAWRGVHSLDMPDTCGHNYDPCQVHVVDQPLSVQVDR